MPPARRAEIGFLTATYFTRAGRWIPLPDPELVYGSLIRRWNHFAPQPLSDTDTKDLLESLLLSAHDTATQPVQLGPGTTSRIGFTGNAAYTLTRTAGPETAHLLATLTHFAAVACIGAQTTHGLGHVHAIPTNPGAAHTHN
jgi:CRISPR-associated endoribonuclease Cas6